MKLGDSRQFRGDDIPLRFTIVQKAGGISLVGTGVDFTVRDMDEVLVCHLSIGSGLVKVSEEPHRLVVEGKIPSAATAGIPRTTQLQFDTQLTLSNGDIRTLPDGTGTFALLKDVTY